MYNSFYQKKAKDAYGKWNYFYDFLLPSIKQEAEVEEQSQVEKSNKVIVSQEVADVLKQVFDMPNRISKYQMVNACAKSYWAEDFSILNSLSGDTMIDILINGYEAEVQTAEQKQEVIFKALHDSFARTCNTVDEFYAYRTGMRDVLATLGYDYNWIKLAKDVKSHTLKITLDKPTEL